MILDEDEKAYATKISIEEMALINTSLLFFKEFWERQLTRDDLSISREEVSDRLRDVIHVKSKVQLMIDNYVKLYTPTKEE
jgi:hypothetical protein